MEAIKQRHHELMYVEREVEEIQTKVEKLQHQMENEIHGIQSKVGTLQTVNEQRLQEELGKQRKKVTENTNIELMTIDEKIKAYERMIKELDNKIIEQDKKVEGAEKKMSQHASLIKDLDLRQFKNEIRIGQTESRLDETERRVSADTRKIQAIERNGLSNMGGDPWLDMGSMLKNKKPPKEKPVLLQTESTSSFVLNSPKKNELKDSKDGLTKKISRVPDSPTAAKTYSGEETMTHRGGGGGGGNMSQDILRELFYEMLDDYKREIEGKYLTPESLDQYD
jgi:chromosome segregation ATPase